MLSIIDPNGDVRVLGNLIPPAGRRYAWTEYGVVPDTPLVPRSEWNNFVPDGDGPDDPHLPPRADQDGIGECNCSATCTAIERVRMQDGLPHVQLSAADLYHRICGGRDQGSLLEDGIREAMANGVATVATVPYLDWRTSHPAAVPERGQYLVLEAFLCPTFEHCYSAALKGFSLISGILWYPNYLPAADGWMPAGRGRPGGHAIMGYKPTRKGSRYGIWHVNSWGQWGPVQGRMVISEDEYGQGEVGGWWAARATVQESGDLPAPRF